MDFERFFLEVPLFVKGSFLKLLYFSNLLDGFSFTKLTPIHTTNKNIPK